MIWICESSSLEMKILTKDSVIFQYRIEFSTQFYTKSVKIILLRQIDQKIWLFEIKYVRKIFFLKPYKIKLFCIIKLVKKTDFLL